MNSDETSFLCNEGELKVLESKDKPCHEKNCSESRLSITVLWVGSTSGVNGPVIFLAKGTKVHPRIRGIVYTLEYDCTDTFGPRCTDILKANLMGVDIFPI